jgi:hypothetical protein
LAEAAARVLSGESDVVGSGRPARQLRSLRRARLVHDEFSSDLSAHPFAEVPWLKDVMRKSGKNNGTIPPQFQTVDPSRLNFTDAPHETMARGGFTMSTRP